MQGSINSHCCLARADRVAKVILPGSKPSLRRRLDLKSTTGDFWYRPDMTAEHHAVTVRHWLVRAPLGFHQEVAAYGRAGSRTCKALDDVLTDQVEIQV